MSSGVVLAVLAAALMHANWNALIRGAPDKRQYTILMHTCAAALAAVGYVAMRDLAPLLVSLVAVFVLNESMSAWAWLGVAAILAGVLTIAMFSGQPLALLVRHRSGRAALLNAGPTPCWTGRACASRITPWPMCSPWCCWTRWWC